MFLCSPLPVHPCRWQRAFWPNTTGWRAHWSGWSGKCFDKKKKTLLFVGRKLTHSHLHRPSAPPCSPDLPSFTAARTFPSPLLILQSKQLHSRWIKCIFHYGQIQCRIWKNTFYDMVKCNFNKFNPALHLSASTCWCRRPKTGVPLSSTFNLFTSGLQQGVQTQRTLAAMSHILL